MGKLILLLALLSPTLTADDKGLIKLHGIYQEQNKAWFKGKLPEVRIGWMDEEEMRAQTHLTPHGYVIEFNPSYNKAEVTARMTMFHEQCHLKYWDDYGDGPKWLGCMRDLAARGAFDELY